MKKTYWAVSSAYYDYGHVCAHIVDSIEAEEKPESTSKSSRRADFYVDWYESLEEAQNAVREAVGKVEWR